MNAIMTQCKKTVLLAIAVVAVSISSATFVKCGSFEATAAIRQSIKGAYAAAVGKQVSREMELDVVVADDSLRAPREALDDPCNTGQTEVDGLNVCDLNCKLQALLDCCVNTNKNVKGQGHEAEKCCKKLRHDIDDVDDRVKKCCSNLEELIESQIDQSAECCLTLKECIGELDETAIDIPFCDFSIADTVNNMDLNMITWLKSLYVLLYEVYLCTCQPCNG